MLKMAGYTNHQVVVWRQPGYIAIHMDAFEKRYYVNILPTKETSTLITQLNKVMNNETI